MPEFRFGQFVFDSGTRRLFRAGREIPIQEKPAALLHLLLKQPGDLVDRDAVTAALWPDTHVALADNLNTTISKLRACLQDKAANPTFIETVPRRGYRFIAPLPTGAAAAPEENPSVRRHYEQGRYHLDRLNPAARQLAKEHFQEALKRDPNSHLGHAGLVEALLWEAGMLGDTTAVAPAIVASLDAAREHAPVAPETQLAEALVAFLVHWDYPRAERMFAELAADGNEPARGWYAAFLLANGRFEEAVTQLNTALESNPLSQTYQHQKALAFYFQDDRARSRQQLNHLARTMDSGDGVTHWLRYHHNERWREPEEAVAALQQALTAWGFPIEVVYPLAALQRELGLDAVRRQLINLLQQAPGMRFTLILLHAQLDECDQAFALINTALALRDWNLCYLSVEPRAINLRADPRYAGVLQNLLRGYLR